MHTVTFFPLGNADSCRIDLAGGQKILFDYANTRCPDDATDKRIDLEKELRADLKAAQGDSFDVVAFTHLDTDHFCKATEFFELRHAVNTRERIGSRSTRCGFRPPPSTRIVPIWLKRGASSRPRPGTGSSEVKGFAYFHARQSSKNG